MAFKLLFQHLLKIGFLERASYDRMNINVFLNYMRFVKLDVKRRRNQNDLCEKLKKGNEKSSIIHKRFCKKQFVFRHQSITFWSLNIIYVNFLSIVVLMCVLPSGSSKAILYTVVWSLVNRKLIGHQPPLHSKSVIINPQS
jgi:hypothetical protein